MCIIHHVPNSISEKSFTKVVKKRTAPRAALLQQEKEEYE